MQCAMNVECDSEGIGEGESYYTEAFTFTPIRNMYGGICLVVYQATSLNITLDKVQYIINKIVILILLSGISPADENR